MIKHPQRAEAALHLGPRRNDLSGDPIASVTDRACSRLRANICVPGGRLCPDFTTEGGIESQTGALGISASPRASTVFMRSAPTSSSLTAIAIRLDCIGKNEIRFSGELPAILQKELLHLPPLPNT